MFRRPITLLVILLVGLTYWYGNLLTALVKPQLPRAEAYTELPDNTLYYQSLGIRSPISLAAQTDPMNVRDWEKIRQALQQGVQLTFESTNFETAPLIFAIGHSFDTYPHRYSAIFAALGQAETGQTINLKVNGQTYLYQVVGKQVLDPNDETAFRSLASTSSSVQRLALVTCWPPTTIKNRLVVITERSIPPSPSN